RAARPGDDHDHRGRCAVRITGQDLYDRLPAYYSDVDTRTGGVVSSLLDIVAAEADRVGRDDEQLHDDLFIETCADWVVSYIGDLLGVATTPDVDPTSPTDAARSRPA